MIRRPSPIAAAFALLIVGLMLLPQSGNAQSPGSGDRTLGRCLVTLIDEAQVPAQEAGVMDEIVAREGMQVRRGDVLAKIDAKQVEIQKRAAEAEERGAREKALSDVDYRFAVKSEELARNEYQRALRANERTSGSVPGIEVDRLKLAWEKAGLQKEQSLIERRIQTATADAKKAEVDGAANNIERRKVIAPLDGMVVRIHSHAGEWLKPGDPVLHLVRLDRLRVEGYVSAASYNPEEVIGRDVRVEVSLARGQKVQTAGRVVFVSPIIEAGDNYRILAEVENIKGPAELWLIKPGMSAEMTIDVKSGPPLKVTRDMSQEGSTK